VNAINVRTDTVVSRAIVYAVSVAGIRIFIGEELYIGRRRCGIALCISAPNTNLCNRGDRVKMGYMLLWQCYESHVCAK
jgi:hypothetical protein